MEKIVNQTTKLIRSKMDEKGVNVTMLAEYCNVSKSYISKMLKMGYTTNLELLANVCDILSITDGQMLECIIADHSRELAIKWEDVRNG